MSTEATMILAAAGLLLSITLIQVSHTAIAHGVGHAMGNRIGGKSQDGIEGRIERTRINTIENLMLFFPVMLLAVATQTSNAYTAIGAVVFVAARAAYIAAYIVGIPGLRTVTWLVGLGGTVAAAWGLASM